jgi:hypothetical protein
MACSFNVDVRGTTAGSCPLPLPQVATPAALPPTDSAVRCRRHRFGQSGIWAAVVGAIKLEGDVAQAGGGGQRSWVSLAEAVVGQVQAAQVGQVGAVRQGLQEW